MFLTGTKYKFYQLNYYTAINKWSDLTAEESESLLNGDVSEVEDDQFDDEQTAKETLLELLSSQQTQKGFQKRRRKRDTSDGGKKRNLSIADMVLVDPNEPELDPRIRIKWIVESDNPDYVPAKRQRLGEPSRAVKDVSLEEVNQISGDNKYNLAPATVMKNVLSSASNWWSTSEQDNLIRENSTKVLNDWRESGCISPPRDQGYCNSCYAISSMSFVEWAFCMSQGNILTPLSVQYMISCGLQMRKETNGEVKLDGCSHGVTRQTMDFVREYGVELEANLPYYERETNCPILPNTSKKHKGYIRPNVKPQVRLAATTNQLDLALKTGPIIVSMREPKNFLAYGGGFVENCEPKGGHAMLVVGNIVEDGIEHLLIKNSMGKFWGYNGFFKFRRSSEALKECVKEFIVPMINFPGRKSQARRVKAYLARQQSNAVLLNEDLLVNDEMDDGTIADTKVGKLLL